MHNRRVSLATALGAMFAGVAGIGAAVLHHLAHAAPPSTFGQRYGANPRSTANGGNGRGAVARSKRAARKRNNIRKHARA